MKKEPQQQTEHICISINLRHQNLADKISGKKNLKKKTMSYNEENQLGAKNEANFDVFQNPDVKLVFKIDVKRIQ